jgi:hypothetical protein
VKSAEEVLEILAAFDLTGSLRDAAELAGCSHTVARYVAGREQGRAPGRPPERRAGVIDPFLEELVERSHGKVRADVAHERITAMGYQGSERTTRRAVAALKAHRAAGRRRVFRPWIPEPSMRAQYDFGDGPRISGTVTILFCLWLAWSRFRVVLPLLDKSQPSVQAAVDVALRRIGGIPTYLLTDNEKTVTVEHVAGVPVRPMQARWPLDQGCRQLCLSLDEPGPTTIGDALFVQRELTDDLLDFYDSHAPGELERRGLRAAKRLGSAALAMRW